MSTEPDPQDGSKPWDPFPGIADITAWLDESNPASPHEDSMRVMKVGEEAGEAIAAYIGMVGQNPRKGVTHTQDDLLKELADVAITALCAMQHFTQDEAVTRAYMAAKIQAIIERSDIHVRVRSGPGQPQDADIQAARTWLAETSENVRSYHQSIPGQPGCTCGRSLACGNDVPDLDAIATLEAALDAWAPAKADGQPQDERDGDMRAVAEACSDFGNDEGPRGIRQLYARFADRIAELDAREAKAGER